MDHGDRRVSAKTRKRKSQDNFPHFDDLINQDLLERVLSRLPPSTFFRLRSVAKRWKSVSDSPTFLSACSQIPFRSPWFLMVSPNPHISRPITVFDSSEKTWKQLNCPPHLVHPENNSIPVAASGGLICFRSESGDFTVYNPLIGSSRRLPPLEHQSDLQAIAMISSSNSYQIVLVSGEIAKLSVQIYNSSTDRWGEETALNRNAGKSSAPESNADDPVYFLSKTGDVVSTNMQRSPSKQYSAVVITGKDEKEMLYFLSSSGTIVACDLTGKSFCEYPRLLPVFSDYSIDVVGCGEELLVVVLSEFLESASLRVWRFDVSVQSWSQVAAMPPAMSHELYGKRVDLNCTGAGDRVLVCVNSTEHCGYVLCDVKANEWTELPACCLSGKAEEFMSAFSFEPRIEVSV